MRSDEWEALCRRCGFCCYEKRYSGGRMVVDLHSPCRYLDEKTHNCSVYERRFTVCPECRRMTIFHALFCGYLPSSCGYVRRFRRWRKSSNPLLQR